MMKRKTNTMNRTTAFQAVSSVAIMLLLYLNTVNYKAFSQASGAARLVVRALSKSDDATLILVKRAVKKHNKLYTYGDDISIHIPNSAYQKGYGYFKHQMDVKPYFSDKHLNITDDEFKVIQNMQAQEFLNRKGYKLEIDGDFGFNSRTALKKYRNSISGNHTAIKEFNSNIPFEHRTEWTYSARYVPGTVLSGQISNRRNQLKPNILEKERGLLKRAGKIDGDEGLNSTQVLERIDELEADLALPDIRYTIRAGQHGANPKIYLRKDDFYSYFKERLRKISNEFTPSLCFSNNTISIVLNGPRGSSISINCLGEIHVSYSTDNGSSRSITYFANQTSTDDCALNWEVCLGLGESKQLKTDASVNACGLSLSSSNFTSFSASVSKGGRTETLFSY